MIQKLLLFFTVLMVAGNLSAQELTNDSTGFEQTPDAKVEKKSKTKKERIDSLLTAKYYKVRYDTAYIIRPMGKITLKVRTNFSGSSFNTEGNIQHIPVTADLSTKTRVTFSIGASYRGLAASIAFNPFKLKGESKDYELNINFYNNRWGVDVSYQDTKTLSGTILEGDRQNTNTYHLLKDMVKMKIWHINAYYAFNHRHFSYPAAFTQSFIQRRSAGSWLAGLSYMGGSIKTTLNIPEDAPQLREHVGYFSIGGGYAYNLVVAKHWLFHITALPTLVVGNYYNLRVNDERRDMKTKFPDFILIGRAAIVRNFKKCFVGANLVVFHSIVDSENLDVNYWRWRARLVFGYRF